MEAPTVVNSTPVIEGTPVIVTEAPTGVAASPTDADLVLADNLRACLSADPTLNSAARNVRMSIYNGQVTLSGTTANQIERDRLHAAVASQPGVAQVIDRVELSTPVKVFTPAPMVIAEAPTGIAARPTSNDMALAESIRNMLATDGGLNSSARNVRISVYDGLVNMTGTTVTQADRERLHSAIAGLPGVYRVNDKVEVDLNR